MAYNDDIKADVKLWLNLNAEYDTSIDKAITSETVKILKYCNRTVEEIDTDDSLKELIEYGVILRLNKRFSEGFSSTGVSGFTTNFNEIETTYSMLLASNKKIRVI